MQTSGQYLHTSSRSGGVEGVKYDSLVQTGRRARLPKCRSVLRRPPHHHNHFRPTTLTVWFVAEEVAGVFASSPMPPKPQAHEGRDALACEETAGELNLSASFGFIARNLPLPQCCPSIVYCIPRTTPVGADFLHVYIPCL